MKKNLIPITHLTRLLSGAALATVMLGSQVPVASATEETAQGYEQTVYEWDADTTCIASGGSEYTKYLTDQVCQATQTEAAATPELGKPLTTTNRAGKKFTVVNRLNDYFFSQQFEHGRIVYYMATGSIAPMSEEVYKLWYQPDVVSLYGDEFKYGIPYGHTVVDGEIVTHLYRANQTSYYLRYDAKDQRVASLVSPDNSVKVGWQNSLSFGGASGDDFSYTASPKKYISTALTDAGYAPYQVGNAKSGLAYESYGGNIYDQVVRGYEVLPQGTPWVINISARAEDASEGYYERALVNAGEIVEKLRAEYPYARIVLQGVVTDGSNRRLTQFNNDLEVVATEHGVGFMDASDYVASPSLMKAVTADNDLTESAQKRLAYQLKWAVRRAIA